MPLTSSGERYFHFHGANVYGYDKLPLETKYERIKEHHHDIIRTVQDPGRYRDFWGNADKPWQFLAWCFEYERMHRLGKRFVSYLPIALDGSCNGLQHFSAMLRDPTGARATNLAPGRIPADIYEVVCEQVIRKLECSGDYAARAWLEYGLTRKITKKPVMTLPYGSTRQNCTKSIMMAILDSPVFTDHWKAALFLSPLVWDSIGETVVAARQAMDWLRHVATVLARNNEYMQWVTPVGFPVMHAVYEYETKCVDTILDRRVKLKCAIDTDTLSRHKQANGSSPNFVHSLDASHLVMTVNAAHDYGIKNMCVIHDSFGTHASNSEALSRITREQFVRMYTEHDPIQELYERYYHVDGIKPPPEKGSFDINEVLKSDYFFA